jgi:hypothetical protein
MDLFLQDVGTICDELPSLAALNLSSNLMLHEIFELPQLKSIRILVLNNTGINWMQVLIDYGRSKYLKIHYQQLKSFI